MAKTYKLTKPEAYSVGEASIEVTDVETKIETRVVNVSKDNILATIAMIEERKQEAIAKFDAEIATNNEMLVEVEKLAVTATIVDRHIEVSLIK